MVGPLERKLSARLYQKNWRELAEANGQEVRTKITSEEYDVVINADEIFLFFLHDETHVIAPTGIRRVGSNVNPDNDKLGMTVMISMELLSSTLLPPFMIIKGEPLSNPNARLDSIWRDEYEGAG